VLDANGNTPLIIATIWNKSDCIKLLLQKRANIFCKDKYGNSLLHIATREGSKESLGELFPYLPYAINVPNNRQFAPLHIAMIKGHNACAQLLVKKGATIDIRNKVGETPLHYAASTGNLQGIELLIGNGACIEAQNNNDVIANNIHLGGYTSLHFAVSKGHLKAVKKLVQLGANIHAKTVQGKTAYELAHEFGHQEIGKYLAIEIINHKANIDIEA
jgi:ankyrin repeat protein